MHIEMQHRRKHHKRGHHRHKRAMDFLRSLEAEANGEEWYPDPPTRRLERDDDEAIVEYTGAATTTEGDFSVDLAFLDSSGTKQTYPVIIDTGSSNLAIAVDQCSTCGVGSTSLELDLDKNYTIKVEYGESGDTTYWSGYRVTGVVSFNDALNGSNINVTAEFAGITTTSTGDNEFFEGENNNGILGLAFSDLADPFCYNAKATGYGCTSCDDDGTCEVTVDPLFDYLVDDGKADNIFSIQIAGLPEEPHGFLNLGGYEPTHLASDINWTTAQTTSGLGTYGYWLSTMDGIAVGDNTLSYDSSTFNTYGGVLIDSGTTELKIPSTVLGSSVEESGTVLNEIYSQYSGSMSDDDLIDFLEEGTCVTKTDLKGLPTLKIFLDGATLEAGHLHYVLPCYYTSGSFAYSYGFGISEGSPTIIGNTIMNGYVTIFDKENYRIGFAEGKNCGVWDDDEDSGTPWYEDTWAEAIWISFAIISCLGGMSWCCMYREARRKKRNQPLNHPLVSNEAPGTMVPGQPDNQRQVSKNHNDSMGFVLRTPESDTLTKNAMHSEQIDTSL